MATPERRRKKRERRRADDERRAEAERAAWLEREAEAERRARARGARFAWPSWQAAEALCSPDCPCNQSDRSGSEVRLPLGITIRRLDPRGPCHCGSGRELRACHGRDGGAVYDICLPFPKAG